MATRLKDTDVVVIGLGAAGGVAVLPLAQAGIDVVGLEAGTWLTKRDFAPDELRNNVRDWPMAVQKAQHEVPTHRVNAKAQHDARRQPSDDERGRRHDAALLGAELAAQSVGLQGRQRNDEALRRVAPPEGIDGRRLAVRLRRARAVLRQDRIRDAACRARPATSRARSIRAATSSKAPRKRAYPMPPLRSTGFIDLMTSAARGLGWHPFPGPALDQLAAVSGPIGVHVSRLLQQGRLPRRCEERPAPDDDSARAGDRPPESRDARARHVDRHRRQRPRHRRDLRHRRPGILPAGEGRAARRATPTRTRASCCCRSRRRFRTASRTITARSGVTT